MVKLKMHRPGCILTTALHGSLFTTSIKTQDWFAKMIYTTKEENDNSLNEHEIAECYVPCMKKAKSHQKQTFNVQKPI